MYLEKPGVTFLGVIHEEPEESSTDVDTCRSFAEVNTLSSDNGPLRWVPVVENVIPIVIQRKQVDEEEVFEVTAATSTGTIFNTDFNLKEIRLKKTSECFVQWRNRKSKSAWGLNFISGEEAKKFLDFCNRARVRSWSAGSSSGETASTKVASGVSHEPTNNTKTGRRTSETPTIVIDDADFGASNPTTQFINNVGDQYNSSSTLVAHNSPAASRSSTPALAGGPDSGFGMEEPSSELSRVSSPCDSDMSGRLSVRSDSDYSVGTRSNFSDLEDPTEIGYFREMARVNSQGRLDISASFHDEADLNSSYSTEMDFKPQSGIAQARQGGATRKAGWLSVKHVLTRVKSNKIELASGRKWKKYWVCLRNGALNFYQCNEKTVSSQDLDDPTFELQIDGCIAQAVPEHAKLDHVLSVSSRLGEAYYFQASNQTDLENWVTAIHSMAASVLAGSGQKGKNEMLQILNEEITRVSEKISSDSKLKKMAELQSTVVVDIKNKQLFAEQIFKWERNLEQLNVALYRLQCYKAAIQGSELPNPQTLLASVPRSTKQTLSRMGMFSVMSFHAVVSARDPSTEEEVKVRARPKRSPSSVGYNKLKSAIFTSLRINDAASVKSIRDRYSPKGSPRMRPSNLEQIPDTTEEAAETASLSSSHSEWRSMGNFLRIALPSHQSTVIPLQAEMTIQGVVENTCNKRQLDPFEHFLKFGLEGDNGETEYVTPEQDAVMEDQIYSTLVLCVKCVYSVELSRSLEAGGLSYGISVESTPDARIVVTAVEEGRLAHIQGVLPGDEILSVNDVDVKDVENAVEDLREALEDPSISLKLRSCRDKPPATNKVTSDAIITSLVVQPPPKFSNSIEAGDLSELIVPPPVLQEETSDFASLSSSALSDATPPSQASPTKTVDELLQSAEQVTQFCRLQLENSDEDSRPAAQLTGVQRLRKVIIELVETERSYVKDLKVLLHRYLDPMKDEQFMSQSEVRAVVGTVHEILDFQTDFHQEMERLLGAETGFEELSTVEEFQNVIYTIGETFLQYTDNFKLYSAFCSSHTRFVELLEPGTNDALQQFLDARNPKNQHSGSLESFLIKPIQRILRYPLLLRTILKLLDTSSLEYRCLLEAIVAIEKVASHINEMQRITEQFSPVFRQLVEGCEEFEVADVSIDHLMHCGKGTWLNCPDDVKGGTLRRYPVSPKLNKKGSSGVMHIFVFEKVLILLFIDRKHKRKSGSASLKSSEEIKFKALIPATSLLIRDHCWANDDTVHSWELVNISETAELGRQESTYLLGNKTAEEKRLLVTNIKKAIKGSMKLGTTLVAAPKTKSHSFRRVNTLNSSDPGPSPLLRVDPVMMLRRSFSHNPEEAKTRRSTLESEMSGSSDNECEVVETKRGSPLVQRKITLTKKSKSVAPYLILDNGLIQL